MEVPGMASVQRIPKSCPLCGMRMWVGKSAPDVVVLHCLPCGVEMAYARGDHRRHGRRAA